MTFNLETFATLELMQLNAAVLEELKMRGVIRTQNVLGDYAEKLVADTLGLTLANNSNAHYDAVDAKGVKYQIKSCKPTISNPSMQLSSLRDLDAGGFDYLIALIFNPDFSVKQAVKISHAIIQTHATYIERTNAYQLILKGAILKHELTEDITDRFTAKA